MTINYWTKQMKVASQIDFQSQYVTKKKSLKKDSLRVSQVLRFLNRSLSFCLDD